MTQDEEIKRQNKNIEFYARTNMLYSDWEHSNTQRSEIMNDKELLDYVEQEIFHKILHGVAVVEHLGYTKFEAGSWSVSLRADEVSRLLDLAKGKNT